MASLDDILTAQKNGVVAINNLTNSNLKFQGTATSATVTANTLVISGTGRLVNFAVLVAGSAAGGIHNSSSVAGATATNQLVTTPMIIGVYPVGMIFQNGLVIKPGSGQSINVTYAIG